MATTPYAELHCHTNFSFLDGASAPDELIDRAVELGQSALAVIADYSAPISNMIALNGEIAQGTSDASLASDVQSLNSLSLAKDQAAHGRRDDGGGCERADLASEFCAEFFDDGHLLEGKGALKVLPAVAQQPIGQQGRQGP